MEYCVFEHIIRQFLVKYKCDTSEKGFKILIFCSMHSLYIINSFEYTVISLHSFDFASREETTSWLLKRFQL